MKDQNKCPECGSETTSENGFCSPHCYTVHWTPTYTTDGTGDPHPSKSAEQIPQGLPEDSIERKYWRLGFSKGWEKGIESKPQPLSEEEANELFNQSRFGNNLVERLYKSGHAIVKL